MIASCIAFVTVLTQAISPPTSAIERVKRGLRGMPELEVKYWFAHGDEGKIIKILTEINREPTDVLCIAAREYYEEELKKGNGGSAQLRVFHLGRFAFELQGNPSGRNHTLIIAYREKPDAIELAWLSPFRFDNKGCRIIGRVGGYINSTKFDPMLDLDYMAKKLKRRVL